MHDGPSPNENTGQGSGTTIASQSNPVSSEIGHGSAEQPTTSPESQRIEEIKRIGIECQSWVDKLRKGQCQHKEALAAITQILVGSSFDAQYVGYSLRNYSLILAPARATGSAEPRSDEEGVVHQNLRPSSESRINNGVRHHPLQLEKESGLHGDSRRRQQIRKASEAGSDSDAGEAPGSDDDDFDTQSSASYRTHSKRLRPNSSASAVDELSDYPWESLHRCRETLSVEQRRTKSLLDSWNSSDGNLKIALKKLLRAPGLPSFPRSQYKNLLSGDFVDLDKVYASVNSLVAETNIKAKISDSISIELEGEVTSTRQVTARISDQASYTVASNLLLSAMLFVFGNYRRDELAAYFTHVQTMFSSLASAHHTCVINYDKAVRLFIAQSNNVAFNDFAKFVHFERANLHPLGVNVATDVSLQRAARERQQLGRRRATRPVEICRNFNAGRCARTASDCPYRHVCSSCHRQGHTAKDNRCSETMPKSVSPAKTTSSA